ncbi:MAG: hypothetical protein AB7F31_06615 [Parachlamydiales bacterium]
MSTPSISNTPEAKTVSTLPVAATTSGKVDKVAIEKKSGALRGGMNVVSKLQTVNSLSKKIQSLSGPALAVIAIIAGTVGMPAIGNINLVAFVLIERASQGVISVYQLHQAQTVLSSWDPNATAEKQLFQLKQIKEELEKEGKTGEERLKLAFSAEIATKLKEFPAEERFDELMDPDLSDKEVKEKQQAMGKELKELRTLMSRAHVARALETTTFGATAIGGVIAMFLGARSEIVKLLGYAGLAATYLGTAYSKKLDLFITRERKVEKEIKDTYASAKKKVVSGLQKVRKKPKPVDLP